jgi:hypothetical protein
LAITLPDVKFRFETTGCAALSGQTVKYPELVGDTAVTFSTTAVALDGIGPTPAKLSVNGAEDKSDVPEHGVA